MSTELFLGGAVNAEQKRRYKGHAAQPTLEHNALTHLLSERNRAREERAAIEKAAWLNQQAENRRIMERHMSIAHELLLDMGKPVTTIYINEIGSRVTVHMPTQTVSIWIGDIDSELQRRLATIKIISAVAGY